MKINSHTITDEQIRALLADPELPEREAHVCRIALSSAPLPAFDTREKARARCAEIWNARKP